MTKNDLARFCSTVNPNIKSSWSAGEYSYATNGHIIVRVSRLEDVPENDSAPKPGKMFDIPDPAEWFPLAGIDLPKKKIVDCSECEGDGTVTHEECEDCGGHKCEACGGTGKEAITREPVSVGNTLFQLVYLRLLKDLPNCHIGPHADPMNPAAFRFDGGDGLLMPMKAHAWKKI